MSESTRSNLINLQPVIKKNSKKVPSKKNKVQQKNIPSKNTQANSG